MLSDSKRTEASFLTISIDLLCLQYAQMPKYLDLAIFVLTDRRTKPITLSLRMRTR